MEWTEITQENCDTVYELHTQGYPIMFARKSQIGNHVYASYGIKHTIGMSITDMAKHGGYYYIVLPKLY